MTVTIKSTPKKYGCIIADPPWMERGGGKIKRGADRHYPLMKTEAICGLGTFVQSIAADDAHLYLWVTNNFLEDGFRVLKAWGFEFITLLTWEKKGKAGLGQYFRGRTEHVMFARRGMPKYRVNPATGKRAQGVTSFQTVDPDPTHLTLDEVCDEAALKVANDLEVIGFGMMEGAFFEAPRGQDVEGKDKHSKKPPHIHQWAEVVSPGPYIEMFALDHRDGWDRWGNGVWEYDLAKETA